MIAKNIHLAENIKYTEYILCYHPGRKMSLLCRISRTYLLQFVSLVSLSPRGILLTARFLWRAHPGKIGPCSTGPGQWTQICATHTRSAESTRSAPAHRQNNAEVSVCICAHVCIHYLWQSTWILAIKAATTSPSMSSFCVQLSFASPARLPGLSWSLPDISCSSERKDRTPPTP